MLCVEVLFSSKRGNVLVAKADIKDLCAVLKSIEKQPLDTYNEHTYNYSSGYRKCARDILKLINDQEESTDQGESAE